MVSISCNYFDLEMAVFNLINQSPYYEKDEMPGSNRSDCLLLLVHAAIIRIAVIITVIHQQPVQAMTQVVQQQVPAQIQRSVRIQ